MVKTLLFLYFFYIAMTFTRGDFYFIKLIFTTFFYLFIYFTLRPTTHDLYPLPTTHEPRHLATLDIYLTSRRPHFRPKRGYAVDGLAQFLQKTKDTNISFSTSRNEKLLTRNIGKTGSSAFMANKRWKKKMKEKRSFTWTTRKDLTHPSMRRRRNLTPVINGCEAPTRSLFVASKRFQYVLNFLSTWLANRQRLF